MERFKSLISFVIIPGLLIGILLAIILNPPLDAGAKKEAKLAEIDYLIRTINPDAEKVQEMSEAFYDYAKKYDVCRRTLIAIAFQESTFTYDEVGTSGEIGLMQIRPATANFLFEEPGNLENPRYNIKVAAKYLAYIQEIVSKYTSEEILIRELALTGYNRGHNKLRNQLKKGKNPQNGYEASVLEKRRKILAGAYL